MFLRTTESSFLIHFSEFNCGDVVVDGAGFERARYTTGTAKTDYSISAYTQPVAGETVTVDNTKTGDNVKVTIPGDITGDNKVNILDVYALGKAYGSMPSSSNWNPNANINCDSTVNNPDMTIICTNYGNQ